MASVVVWNKEQLLRQRIMYDSQFIEDALKKVEGPELIAKWFCLVLCGQTTISAQGVYRVQYKRLHRKGSGRFHSADLVFTLSNVSIY